FFEQWRDSLKWQRLPAPLQTGTPTFSRHQTGTPPNRDTHFFTNTARGQTELLWYVANPA
ncbi:MAG: hypothetical protein U0973_13340, partial [Xanthomonadaceae bacterium]|nr:hypothetical protein [Xanthomonadaceae bacterium]